MTTFRPRDGIFPYECTDTSRWLDELLGRKIHLIKTVVVIQRDGLYNATADNVSGDEILQGPIAAWKIRYIFGPSLEAYYGVEFINVRNVLRMENYGRLRREAVESSMEYQIDFRRIKMWTRSVVWNLYHMFG